MDSIFIIDEFVNVRPGEPFRLLPFGTLIKGGKERNITPEFAAKFKLPHFKPPIKLGSHDDETPAGGHINSLYVGEDGLYAVPEFTDKGAKAVEEGDFKYQSPEIIWEGNGLEDPNTGKMMEGPLIVGDALLHTPHLGEAAALYQIVKQEKGENQMGDTVQVDRSLWEKLTANLFAEKPADPVPAPEAPEEVVETEEYKALAVERDDYKAKFDTMEAEKVKSEKLSVIAKEFDTEEYGTAYIELGKADESAEMLSKMDDEVRAWVLTNFKALSKQIKESALTEELGTAGEGIDEDDSVGQLNAVILARAKKDKVSYNEAMQFVIEEQPDLVKEAY